MLNIEKNINAAELNIALSGRLDTTTAPELEKELKALREEAIALGELQAAAFEEEEKPQ